MSPTTRGAARAAAALARTDGLTAALPDELLGPILGLAGVGAGASVTLVCKRWQRLFWSEAGLWRDLTLDALRVGPARDESLQALSDDDAERWLAGKHTLLSRVLPHVEALTLRGAFAMQHAAAQTGGWEVSQLLRLPLPARLTVLQLDYCTVKVAHAVQRLTGLTRLHLLDQLSRKSAGSLLPRLRGLCSLHCSVQEWETAVAEALVQLSRLTELSQDCFSSGVAFAAGTHTALAGLSSLALKVFRLSPELVLSVARFSRLTALQLSSWQDMLGGGLGLLESLDVRSPLSALQRQLAAFPVLADFECRNMWSSCAGGIQVGSVVLGTLKYSLSAPDSWQGQAGEAAPLRTMSLQLRSKTLAAQGSVQSVLEALVPVGASLTSLTLHDSKAEAAALADCARLAGLQALRLEEGRWRPGAAACLAALLGRAPSLTQLSMQGASVRPMWPPSVEDTLWLQALPPSLAQATGLRVLALPSHRLGSLQQGPLWIGLQSLDLSKNQLGPRLPRALASATALTSLLLDSNSQLRLAVADVRDVLERLRRLCLLSLHGTAGVVPAAAQRVRSSMPLLQLAL
ncbi:hypothetical protein ABPG75_006839 [Micractinium tetrahymenae]